MRIQKEDREKAKVSSEPPTMPIVLDEAAIEDILGVSSFHSGVILATEM